MVAELEDALALGASVRKDLWVRLPPMAPFDSTPLGLGPFLLLPEQNDNKWSEMESNCSPLFLLGESKN